MKPVSNTIPKRIMFMCELRSKGVCARICDEGAGEPHSHELDRETTFYCSHYNRTIWCKEVK